MICAEPARSSAIPAVASWSRFNSCWGTQPRIHGYIFVAEFVHEFESQQVVIKAQRASHVRSIDHCMVKGQLLATDLRCPPWRRYFFRLMEGLLRVPWRGFLRFFAGIRFSLCGHSCHGRPRRLLGRHSTRESAHQLTKSASAAWETECDREDMAVGVS